MSTPYVKSLKSETLKTLVLLLLVVLSGCAPQSEVTIHTDKDASTEHVDTNDVVELPSDPTRPGHRFIGWYFDEDVWENRVPTDYEVTGDVEIFAYFEREYKVEFVVEGKTYHVDHVVNGERISVPDNPDDPDFKFMGWYEDRSLTNELDADALGRKHTGNYTFHAYTKKVYSEDAVYDLLQESVFKVEILNRDRHVISQGSGFFIKEDGTFVTNAHVVEDAWYGRINEDAWPFDKEIEVLYEYDSVSDFAILKIRNLGNMTQYEPVTFSNDYRVGDTVYSIGYPSGSWDSQINAGKILTESSDYIVTDAYINHGSSGGVTVNEHGEVIGMTTVKFDDLTFGSIPASVFDTYASSFLGSGKTLQEYFNPAIEVDLSSVNFENYFNIDVASDVSYDSYLDWYTITYDITITPYHDYELAGYSSSIALFIDIDTNYRIYSESTYGTIYKYDRTKYSSTNLYLYDFNDFKASKTHKVTIYETFDNIYSVDTFDVDVSLVTGDIQYYID